MVLNGNKVTTVVRHLIHFHEKLLDADGRHVRIDHFLQSADFIRHIQLVVALEFQPTIVDRGEIIQTKAFFRFRYRFVELC
ncbi:MAG: hypothetical protein PWP74_1868 [Shewanella sp.]|nr:hypothetical protein [Shewanella sp.]